MITLQLFAPNRLHQKHAQRAMDAPPELLLLREQLQAGHARFGRSRHLLPLLRGSCLGLAEPHLARRAALLPAACRTPEHSCLDI